MSVQSSSSASAAVRPLFLRVSHWVNALALLIMILSGWRIYNASPFYPFDFPNEITLGGWLAGALALHFSAMWLLIGNGLLYFGYSLLSGHLRRDLLPPGPRSVWRDLRLAFAGDLPPHVPGRYNAVQRASYICVALLVALAILSGVAIWKPVQFQELTALLGGFETARKAHFFAMVGIVLFIIAHVTMAVRSRGLLISMITGRASHQDEASP